MNAKQLAKALYNIGLTTAQHLIEAGIDTPEKLRALGAEQAYLQMIEAGVLCRRYHAVYLYALEGAIQHCHWQDIPEDQKEAFKQLTKSWRAMNAP